MREPISPRRGPWHHRLLTGFFSVLLGVLFYWLLGFVVNDIRSWPGPDYGEVEGRMVEASLRAREEELGREIGSVTRSIADDSARQSVLRDSTDNSSRTLDQLVELQRLQAQRGMEPNDTERAALEEARRLFLDSQQKYQDINSEISVQTERLRALEADQRTTQQALEIQRRPARAEFQRLQARHQFKLAAVKLGILVPLLGLVVVLFLRWRHGLYAPAVYALGIATLLKVVLVMHEHFPRIYFKYILLGASLLLVARILVYLLRLTTAARPDWVLKQYREAYEHFFCPICNYPIRRGPMRFAFWTRRSLKRMALAQEVAEGDDTPYVCPVCGTRLFEKCAACDGIRHSLLPTCRHCGAERSPGT